MASLVRSQATEPSVSSDKTKIVNDLIARMAENSKDTISEQVKNDLKELLLSTQNRRKGGQDSIKVGSHIPIDEQTRAHKMFTKFCEDRNMTLGAQYGLFTESQAACTVFMEDLVCGIHQANPDVKKGIDKCCLIFCLLPVFAKQSGN